MSESIGAMEGAFFVSRGAILAWLNDLLKLGLTKVEQTASGAAACQILDAIYPGTVPLHKVNWKASQEYEYVGNYKILQQTFIRHKIAKQVEVEKLCKGKYQDNLEFMQWLKRYYDMNADKSVLYDAAARRKEADECKRPDKTPPRSHNASRELGGTRRAKSREHTTEKRRKQSQAPIQHTKEESKGMREMDANFAVEAAKKENKTVSTVAKKDEEKEKLRQTAEALRKERDFYFGKLRDLEILLHFHEKDGNKFMDMVKKILYATEDDNIAIDESGNLAFQNEADGGKKPN